MGAKESTSTLKVASTKIFIVSYRTKHGVPQIAHQYAEAVSLRLKTSTLRLKGPRPLYLRVKCK